MHCWSEMPLPGVRCRELLRVPLLVPGVCELCISAPFAPRALAPMRFVGI